MFRAYCSLKYTHFHRTLQRRIQVAHCTKRISFPIVHTNLMEIATKPQQEVELEGTSYQLVEEGTAKILYARTKNRDEAFYNPAQEVNRDLSIAVIKTFMKHWNQEKTNAKKESSSNENAEPTGIKVLEALSATGLRSIRYMKEIEGIRSITANDLDEKAVSAIKRNVEYNGLTTDRVIPNQGDASLYMQQHPLEFDVIDIDPYGSASIFLTGAVQSVSEGGMLCVTCTDMAVLCGQNAETCYAKYGSASLQAKYSHEMGLRILLSSIESHAVKYKRYIVPILSLSIDYYVRVFVRVYTSANDTKKSCSKLSSVYQCVGCDAFWLQPLFKLSPTSGTQFKVTPHLLHKETNKCTECERGLRIGGPIWHARMHDVDWLDEIATEIDTNSKAYNQAKKIYGLLSVAKDELHDQVRLPAMCNTVHVTTPPLVAFRSAVINAGYQISGAHANPTGIKTDAPISVLWDILRCWQKEQGGKTSKRRGTNSPGAFILEKPPSIQADFTPNKKAQINAQAPRFIQNPANWGPGTRAGKKRVSDETRGKTKKQRRQEMDTEANNKPADT